MLWRAEEAEGETKSGVLLCGGRNSLNNPACEITRPMIKNIWVVHASAKETVKGPGRVGFWKLEVEGGGTGQHGRVSQPKRASRPLNSSRYHLFHATIPNLESRRG